MNEIAINCKKTNPILKYFAFPSSRFVLAQSEFNEVNQADLFDYFSNQTPKKFNYKDPKSYLRSSLNKSQAN